MMQKAPSARESGPETSGGDTRRRIVARAATAVGRLYIFLASMFLLIPVAIVVLVSLDTADYVQFPPQGLTFKWYVMVFNSDTLMLAIRNSAVVGVASMLLCISLGVPAAMVIARRRFPGRDALYALMLSPLTVPWVVMGIALLFLWSTFGLSRNLFSLIVGHTLVGLPYVIRTCVAVLASTSASYELAARTLGATPWRTFVHVTFPMMRMGVVAGATFCLLISFINVPVPLFLTTAQNVTIPVAIFSYMLSNFDPGVAAIATVQLLIIMVVFYIAQRIARLDDFLY